MALRRLIALAAAGLAAVLLFHMGLRCMGAQMAAPRTSMSRFQQNSNPALHADVTRGHAAGPDSIDSHPIDISDAV